MLVKAAEVECWVPLSRSGVHRPLIRADMDDLIMITTLITEGRWNLKGLKKTWPGLEMNFKPVKCRSLVLKKATVMEKVWFTITGPTILILNKKPVKSLSKTFNSSLKDTAVIQQTIKNLEEWLIKINKSRLPRLFRSCLLQHTVLPWILWPLLPYDFSVITMEVLERTISNWLRR